MHNNKSAIDYFKLKISILIDNWNPDAVKFYEETVAECKRLEKDQIIKAFNEGTFYADEKITAEEYYNNKYNK